MRKLHSKDIDPALTAAETAALERQSMPPTHYAETTLGLFTSKHLNNDNRKVDVKIDENIEKNRGEFTDNDDDDDDDDEYSQNDEYHSLSTSSSIGGSFSSAP